MAKCPVDGSEMEEKTVEVIDPVVLDVCLKCDGIWMDKGELKRISKDELIELRLSEKGRGIRMCPRCRNPMHRSELNGIILDECDCGIYFDKGEVEKVIGKRLAYKSKDGNYSIGVTATQLKELISKGNVKVESLEIRLIKEKDDQA
jgi:Zn-finger nucleic acid-binding protein